MVMFTLTFFDRKHPFGAILVQKTKIDSFGLNVVPRIIRLCKVPWWSSLFLFSTGITVFGQILPKKSLDYFEYAKFHGGVWFFRFRPELFFRENLVPNFSIVYLK